MVFTAEGLKGIGAHVCRTETDAELDAKGWRVSGKMKGMKNKMNVRKIASDGRGRLFVRDIGNDCLVQEFSAEGNYVRAIPSISGIIAVTAMTWCHSSDSLVLAHHKDEKNYICVIRM